MQLKSRGGFIQSYGHLVLRRTRICMVESLDIGEIQGRFFLIIWSFGFKEKSYCMVKSLDTGEVQGKFL